MEDKQKINIRFGSWDLPMTVLRKDEHIYRNAEALMKERYAFYTRNYKGLATERYMIMCMLDIAVRLCNHIVIEIIVFKHGCSEIPCNAGCP